MKWKTFATTGIYVLAFICLLEIIKTLLGIPNSDMSSVPIFLLACGLFAIAGAIEEKK